jgi:hypothetical protein
VARLLRRGFKLYPGCRLRMVAVNGEPAVLAIQDGHLIGVVPFAVRDGRVQHLLAVANPGKLTYLSLALKLPAARARHHRPPLAPG